MESSTTGRLWSSQKLRDYILVQAGCNLPLSAENKIVKNFNDILYYNLAFILNLWTRNI